MVVNGVEEMGEASGIVSIGSRDGVLEDVQRRGDTGRELVMRVGN